MRRSMIFSIGTCFRVCNIKLMVLWFSHSRALGLLRMATKTDLSISVDVCPVSYILLKSFHNKSTPSSCKAISISTTTSSGPAAFPVWEFCNAYRASSFSIEKSDLYDTASSSSFSSLSSWNEEVMYSSQRFLIRGWHMM